MSLLPRDVAPFVHDAGKNAIVARDVDDLARHDLAPWLAAELRDPGRKDVEITTAERDGVSLVRLSRGEQASEVAVVGVGLAESSILRDRFGITRFAADDYVLLLATEQRLYEAVDEFKPTPYEIVMRKRDEVRALFLDNGIPIDASKRLLQIFRAIVGFRASPAEFAAGIVERAGRTLGTDDLLRVVGPLVDEINRAARTLSR